eukprot:CAMPEP_0119150148 /NCGR_PEP_ID=MMETSP1310-20130426/44350_1 /TAXON_ID=464262 /ORGANISM="Genus nov. species nov., Strain RCC2339" /LENGTH=66 /DNA_ID=CAMNT_0007142299 /DNA_START=687 /DNA_END=888 /DNA_ORIENTATION=-
MAVCLCRPAMWKLPWMCLQVEGRRNEMGGKCGRKKKKKKKKGTHFYNEGLSSGGNGGTSAAVGDSP